jgi:predicted enzyme related to lactoylglutathione lyase
MSGEPAFFEIGVEDPQRGKAFYGALFGWDFTPGPSAAGGFMIGTACGCRRQTTPHMDPSLATRPRNK